MIKQLLFSFKGRINRKQYWLGCLFSFLLLLVPIIILSIYSTSEIYSIAGQQSPAWLAAASSATGKTISIIIMLPFIILAIWSNFAVLAKRFHDLNLTGWLSLVLIISSVLPILGAILFFLIPIILGCIKGTPGPNKYGQPVSDK